ncbi:uncharacterized protein PHA67_017055 [Liasis olivaceus]
MLMRRLPLLKKPAPPKVITPRTKPSTKDKDTQISPSFETLLKKPLTSGTKKKKENKTVAKLSSNKVSSKKVSSGKTHPSTSRKKSSSFAGGNVSQTSVPTKKGKKSNVIYNVHITVYDRWRDINSQYLKETAWEDCIVCSGLSRVCTVFNVLKCGRIHVSKLLFALHTLKILVTRDEMYEALQLMNVDVLGTLNFSEFLEIVNQTSPFSETEGFQNTLWAFRKIRKDMVAVDDLSLVLANLEVNLCCETIQQALKCTHINKNMCLNFKDFLLAVRELQRSPAEEAFQTEYAVMDRRPFQDVTGLVSADSRWRRRYQSYCDDEISIPTSLYFSGQPCSHTYSDLTQLQRKVSCQFDQKILKNVKMDEEHDITEMKNLQSDIADQKVPSAASSIEQEEGNNKEFDTIEVNKERTDVADQESTNAEHDFMEEKKPSSDIADQNIPSVENADGDDKTSVITEEERS